MAKKRPKLRTEFRKNHQGRVRHGDFTRDFHSGDKSETLADMAHDERVSGKGELTRKRTIIGSDARPEDSSGLEVRLSDHEEGLRFGCVLSVHGLRSRVLGDDGHEYMCIVRQLLKSLTTDQRNVVATGIASVSVPSRVIRE